MKRTCKIALFVLMVVVVLASMTACGKTKLDVADGVTVVFSGADGNGHAELIHDEENPSEMAPKFLLKLVKDKKVAADDWQKLMTIGSAVSYDLDKSSKLSNGDTVTVTISVDKDVLNSLKMTAESAKLTFTVKGLTEPTVIHPFEDFTFSFDGISPGVQVKDFIDARKVDDVIVHYGIEEPKPYRAGQELTVKAWIATEDMDNYRLSEDTMTVTVTDVDEYILDINDLKSDTLDAMRTKADALIAERLQKWDGYYTYNGFEYVGYEFFSHKNYHNGYANYVYLYYKINASDAGADFSSYYYVRFDNVLQHQDGTQEVNLEHYDIPTIMFFATLKDYQTLESRTSEIHSMNDYNFNSQQNFL